MSRHQLSYVYQTHFCLEKSRVFNYRFQELDKLRVLKNKRMGLKIENLKIDPKTKNILKFII